MTPLRLTPAAATAANFAPYGRFYPAGAAVFTAPSFAWYENLNASLRVSDTDGMEIGFVQVTAADPRQWELERHQHTREVMIAVGGTLYITLAVGEAVNAEDYAAFILPPGSAAVLDPGIWHLAPKSTEIGAAAIILYNPGTGTQDKEVITVADRGFEVDILW